MWTDLLHRVRSIFRRRAVETELDEELRFHLERQAAKYEAQGLTPDAATRQARLDIGGLDQVAEECRDARGVRFIEELWSDVRYAARSLWRTPVFVIAVCLILGIGIGLNMTLFQIINATVLRPHDVKDPGSLVRFWRKSPNSTSDGVPFPATQFLGSQNTVLSAVLLHAAMDVAWGERVEDSIAGASFVSANWFEELGIVAAKGRVFSESMDAQTEDLPAVVLSHRFWVNRFNGEAGAIGRTIRINGQLATIAGVAPASFYGLGEVGPHLWLPIDRMDYFNPGSGFRDSWFGDNTDMYGRLRLGVSLEAAREGMRAGIQELARRRPDAFRPDQWLEPLSGSVRFMSEQERREGWQATALAFGLTLLVFSVACGNVCSLMLSRAVGRFRELGIRTALGASQLRVIRGLLAEAGLLAVLGAVAGVVLGCGAAVLIVKFQGFQFNLTPDWRTCVVALVFAFLSMLAVGLVPGWIISRRPGLALVIKDGGQQISGGLQQRRLNQALVALQVAGSCVLLVIAGLVVSKLERLQTGTGFAVESIAILRASPSRFGFQGLAARSYWEGVKSSIASHPETLTAAFSSHAPLGQGAISEFPAVPGLQISVLRVEKEFFPLMGIPIVAGRAFESTDDPQGTVVVSRRLAMRMYGTLDVIGLRYPKHKPSMTIVGVSEDAAVIRYPATDGAEQYTHLTPSYFEPPGGRAVSREPVLLVRAKSDPALLLAPLKEAARRANSRVLAQSLLLESNLETRIEVFRLTGFFISMISLMALSLACLGVFGLVSYGAALRTREVGIRLALGAERGAVALGLLRALAHPAFWGALAGFAVAFAVAKTLEGDPFYLSSLDTRAYAAALLILFATAGTAALIPAIRALRSDPLKSLRHE